MPISATTTRPASRGPSPRCSPRLGATKVTVTRAGKASPSTSPVSASSPLDVGRGIYAPTTSVDEYFAELATWFGVPAADLDLVLPNVRSFYTPGSAEPPIGFLTA